MILVSSQSKHALASLLALAPLFAGCASSRPAPAPSTAASRPWAAEQRQDWSLNERQRELARAGGGFGGFFHRGWISFAHFVADTADAVTGTPAKLGQMLAAKDDPDARRTGIMELVDRPWGQTATYVVAYSRLAEDGGQDPLVRASAIRALNRSRARQLAPLYVKNLTDANDLVRLEACKALNRMPDAAAVDPLLKLVGPSEENKDVRIAAAEALRHYKRLDVGRALVGLLAEKDFGIAWQAHASLKDLARGKDFGYSEAEWLKFFSGSEKPLG